MICDLLTFMTVSMLSIDLGLLNDSKTLMDLLVICFYREVSLRRVNFGFL